MKPFTPPRRDRLQALVPRTVIDKYGVEKILKKRRRYAECLHFDCGLYTGEFVCLDKAILRQGPGEFIYKDGVVYSGGWHCGDRTGGGTLTWSSGDKFEVR
jgi:hypothetical protein